MNNQSITGDEIRRWWHVSATWRCHGIDEHRLGSISARAGYKRGSLTQEIANDIADILDREGCTLPQAVDIWEEDPTCA